MYVVFLTLIVMQWVIFLINYMRRNTRLSRFEKIGYWKSLSYTDFEVAVSKLFELEGYKTELTKKTRDKGVDIWIWKNKAVGIVQCKQYQKKVSSAQIRQFFGTLKMHNASFGYFVTSSFFTIDAINETEILNRNDDIIINLCDLDFLIKKSSMYGILL